MHFVSKRGRKTPLEYTKYTKKTKKSLHRGFTNTKYSLLINKKVHIQICTKDLWNHMEHLPFGYERLPWKKASQ